MTLTHNSKEKPSGSTTENPRRGRFILPAAAMLASSLICGCACDNHDHMLADSFSGLYHSQAENSPARYALNQTASAKTLQSRQILKGDVPSTPGQRQQAREHLYGLREKIQLSIDWPIKETETFHIPFCANPPLIDGKLDDGAWKDALTFTGEFPLNQPKMNTSATIWKIMWDINYLYVGASIPDQHLIHGDHPPGKGDAIEIFLMPDPALRCYREIVVGPGSKFFSAIHVNNKWGTFINGTPDNPAAIHAFTSTATSFVIEIAVPFTSLPNYRLGNPPNPGEAIYFAILRADRDHDAQVTLSSVRPMLHCGHNVFAYSRGILLK